MMRGITWGVALAALVTTALGAQDTPIRATTEDGRWVLLHANGKWEFEARPAEEPLSGARFERPPSSTAQREIFPNVAAIYYDPSKWTPQPSDDRTRFTFEHTNGDGYALVIKERIQVPLRSLKEIAFTNARNAAPDAAITYEDSRIVNGVKVICLQIQGTASGVPFTYFGYYYSGKAGIIQVVTYTGQNLFEEYQSDFQDFLNGLTVTEAR